MTVVIVVVILVVAAVAAYFVVSNSGATTTTTSYSTQSTSSSTSYNQTVVVDETLGEPTGLDTAWSADAPAYEIEQNIYQGLIWYHGSSTNQYEGVLATGWTVSPDAKTYTFQLRQGVQFSDGKPFNAYSVWFNYYRLTLNNGPVGYIMGPMSAGGPFTAGSITINDLNTFNFTSPTPSQLAVMENPNQSIQVVDQYTIAFHLPQPLGSFLARLASPPGGIEQPDFIQSHGGVQANATINQYVDSHSAPGTGPYVVENWLHGTSITLGLNPHYWGPTPDVSKVVIQYKSNTLDAINDLKTGSAQMLYTVPVNLIGDIQGTSGITLEQRGLSYDITWLSLNTAAYPLNITDVRLAINYAINKSSLVQNILHGYGSVFQGPIPKGMFGYNDSIQPTGYNLTLSKQLLTEAGFPNGQGIRPLTLMYYTGDPVSQAAVQAIKSDLAQIGITVTLVATTQANWVNTLFTVPRTSNYPDIAWLIWFPDFAYPDDYAPAYLNIGTPLDNANINDTLLNQWTAEVPYLPTTAQQAQMYSMITLRSQALSPYVWLWQDQTGAGIPAYTNNIQNVNWNPILYGFNYSALYVTPPS